MVLKEGQLVSAATLRAFVNERLAPYKTPHSTAFIAELPKTVGTKIQRFKLRDAEDNAKPS